MPLPERYTHEVPEIAAIWEPEGNFKAQTQIWLAQCEAGNELYGEPPTKDLELIREALVLTPDDIVYLNQPDGHETNRLLRLVQGRLPQRAGNNLHKGNTSSDILDTSIAIQSRESLDYLENGFDKLQSSLGKLALKHRETIQVGRSHGQQAIPQTFGRQVVGWYAEVGRGVDRIKRAREVISYGKLSGEIGTNVVIEPDFEELTLKKLGLKPDQAPSQVISRDRHAEMIALLGVNSGTLARIASNIRLLSMTEIGEVREPFGDQQGSSSMPHKRNPELAERTQGISRRIRGAVGEELDAQILWLERDISHSSTERFVFPDVFGGLAYMTKIMRKVIDGLEVDPERMKQNLESSHGAVFSPRVMNALIESGKMSRTEAYELVKNMVLETIDNGKDFYDLVSANPEVTDVIPKDELKGLFEPQYYLRNIDVAFRRTGLIAAKVNKSSAKRKAK